MYSLELLLLFIIIVLRSLLSFSLSSLSYSVIVEDIILVKDITEL